MRTSWKLTKKKQKTDQFKETLKMYNITNFETIRFKMNALGNINP